MLETSRALAAALCAWRSFDGFSYHGLAWPERAAAPPS
jgi:hypothetical protein